MMPPEEKICAAAPKPQNMPARAMYDEAKPDTAALLVQALARSGKTVTAAESCTGGLICQRITAVSGSSAVFGYGFITYWEQAKAKLVGVDPAVIERFNVVSAPVAAQMALGARTAAGADYAVAVTGVAGPTGGDAVRPVGTVYLAAADETAAYVRRVLIQDADRATVRAAAAQLALEMALALAEGKPLPGCTPLPAPRQADPAALDALNAACRP